MRWRGKGRTTFGHRMKWMEVVEVFDPYLSFRLRITTTARLPPTRARKKIGLCCFYPLDVRAEFAQFFIEMLVAAIDVIDAADFSNSVGLQSRKHQRGRRAQVARHYRRAEKTIHALDHRGRPLQLHLRTHALQLRHMHVTLRKNIFRHGTDALARGEQRAHLRLHVSRESRDMVPLSAPARWRLR